MTDQTTWNQAQQYYDRIQSIESAFLNFYAGHDIRNMWHFTTPLYDHIRFLLKAEEQEKMDKEYESIESDILTSKQGDRINSLYDDSPTGDLEEYYRQQKKIRNFRNKVYKLMHERGMILPWTKARNLETAGVTFEDA